MKRFYHYNSDASVLATIITILIVLLGLGLAFGGLCLEGWLVMLLWNAVMPLIWANAPTLTFWVSVGIVLLIDLLFGRVVKVKKSN
jgi:hypothetical protein